MTYRYLPWTRRGLVTQVSAVDSLGDDLPVRAEFPVGVRVNQGTPINTTLRLYGPGDVIGVDPRVIIRTEPKRFVDDFQPNYLAAIEFDPSDFCWMFTPAAANADERLRPWLVLVVVEQRDGVAIETTVQRPLPVLSIQAPAVPADELPDLAESWAWAHAQVITEGDSEAEIVGALQGAASRNLSRLLCPRRLKPSTHYYACLVPAFEVGRQAGLGQTPAADATTTPAWRSGTAATGTVVLPLYFHWEFATGAGGDFEDLVDRLEARPVAENTGKIPMYIGNAGPGISPLPADDARAVVDMEGALRAPSPRDPHRIEIPFEMLKEFEALLNAPDEHLEAGTPANAPPVGPPLYASHHLQAFRISESQSRPWFADLNLDPRMRAAAALGTQVVRANQEDLMSEAWAQVGDVLAANRALNWAELSKQAGRRVHARHFATMDVERVLKATSPMHRRIVSGSVTVSRRLGLSHVPDATTDPALRRASSAQNRSIKRIARRARLSASATAAVDVDLIEPINNFRLSVEDLSTVPDGLFEAEGLKLLSIPPRGNPLVDMSPVGGAVAVPASVLRQVRSEFIAAQRQPRDPPLVPGPVIDGGGIVDAVMLDRVALLAGEDGPLLSAILEQIAAVGASSVGAVALLVETKPGSKLSVSALDLDRKGQLRKRAPDGAAAEPLAVLDPSLAKLDGATLGRVIGRLPPGALTPETPARGARSEGMALPCIERVPGTPLLRPGGARMRPMEGPAVRAERAPAAVTTLTLALPTRDPRTRVDFADAIRQHASLVDKPVTIGGPPLRLPTAAMRQDLLTRSDPAILVPRRMQARLQRGGHRQVGELGPVMAAPEFPTPMYRALAEHGREFLLPGIGNIPPDTITLLQTNPRFVEAFLIGLNVEMNRELLWREYPSDRRGTAFRRFWERSDGSPDIPPIHQWPTANSLGQNMLGGIGEQIVLLVRGELLRRYPNTILFAAMSTASGEISSNPAERREPTLMGRLDPDLTFAGFDLKLEDLRAGRGWYFVLQEQPTEPRFGFDAPASDDPPLPAHWFDATWGQVGVAPGGYLLLAGNPLAGVVRDGAQFGANSGHLAKITLQLPVMVAVHADLALRGLT
jgi:hypothetical protein